MANERIPNDPYRAGQPNPADAPYRYKPRSDNDDDDISSDNELQIDPDLTDGPASGGKIALLGLGIALVLGAVFYGLNNSSINQVSTATTATTAQNAAPTSPPAAPPGMRDVTPRANNQPGMTTGASTRRSADPKAPPAPAPSGGTE